MEMLAIRELYLARSASCSDSEPLVLWAAGPAGSLEATLVFEKRGRFVAGRDATRLLGAFAAAEADA